MIKYSNKKVIEVQDWDELITNTYGRIYSFQQQDGCQDRQTISIIIPSEDNNEEMHDSIPEIINGDIMGVKFEAWLNRDPKAPLNPTDEELKSCNYYYGREDKEEWKNSDFHINIFWERNFYPDLQTVANDLHKRGLIEAGEYSIHIDW